MACTRTALSVASNSEFSTWLANLADSRTQPISTVVEVALKELAERTGFEPPPQRVGNRRRQAVARV